MKTTRNADSCRRHNIAVLEGALALVQQNLKGNQGGERIRLQAEEAGIMDALRKLGS